jgi:hypothetical protein
MQWPRTGKSSVKRLGYTVSLSGMPGVKCQGCAMSRASDIQYPVPNVWLLLHLLSTSWIQFNCQGCTVYPVHAVCPGICHISRIYIIQCPLRGTMSCQGCTLYGIKCEVYNVQCPLSGLLSVKCQRYEVWTVSDVSSHLQAMPNAHCLVNVAFTAQCTSCI